MKESIVLKKLSGEVIRVYHWASDIAYIAFNKKTGRLNLHKTKQTAECFINLGILDKKLLKNKAKNVLNVSFCLSDTSKDKICLQAALTKPDYKIENTFKKSAVVFLFVMLLSAYFFTNKNQVEKKPETKIVKKESIDLRHSAIIVPKPISVADRQRRIRRRGALAILGALKSGKQTGGLNLNFSKTSKGVGLGGKQGSGGAQTSLYATGLIKVGLGVGKNIKGAGGYGKIGSGGGKAGTGRLSLIGSRGVSSLSVGRESISSGGLDKAAIAAVIQAHLSEVRFCYEKALQGQPDLKGRVVVGFKIKANGLVKAASIKASDLNFPSVEFCIVKHLKSWKFPYPRGGVMVSVSYPFVLQRNN